MKRLDDDPHVKKLADDLGLNWEQNAVAEIIRFCRRKVERWIAEQGEVPTVTVLEELICARLGLVFEEVWSDEELHATCRRYAERGEPAFLFLADQLDSDNLGTLVERRSVPTTAPDHYVALIDCRGVNAHRRFFTRWHEIAHLLTRCFDRAAGLEALMEKIAAEFAFFPPVFVPALLGQLPSRSGFSFDDIARVRTSCCPTASYQAVTLACVRNVLDPVLYVEAELGLKKGEQRELASGQMLLFPDERPSPKLRAVMVVPNQAARDGGLYIHPNMEVPEESIIARLYRNCGKADARALLGARENLSWWRHSDGSRLRDLEVRVEVQLLQDRVLALVGIAR